MIDRWTFSAKFILLLLSRSLLAINSIDNCWYAQKGFSAKLNICKWKRWPLCCTENAYFSDYIMHIRMPKPRNKRITSNALCFIHWSICALLFNMEAIGFNNNVRFKADLLLYENWTFGAGIRSVLRSKYQVNGGCIKWIAFYACFNWNHSLVARSFLM